MKARLIILPLLSAALLTPLVPQPADAAVRTVTSHGQTYVPVNSIAASYSMDLSTPSKTRIRLRNKWHSLEFETDGRRCWVNGTMVWLSSPLRKIGWQWAMEQSDFNKTVDPSLRPYAYLSKAGARTVVLDPGHGGYDKGAISPRNVYEKLLVLDIAKRVRNHLQARGLRVVLTRESDIYPSLTDRCKKAASVGADLFVSIHANSTDNRNVHGIETFTLALPGEYSSNAYGSGKPSTERNPGNRHDAANAALGYRIQQNLVKATGREDRGVKRARFQVLREAPCPAVLVETAFLSNAKEEAIVIEAAGREKIARGISDGIAAYLYDIKRAK
ncbi:MAG: N-acetylmuramoyl-L-alanine amidase [Kiritimatiellales bacterium]